MSHYKRQWWQHHNVCRSFSDVSRQQHCWWCKNNHFNILRTAICLSSSIMVIPDIIWSFQVLNRVLYLQQPEAPKRCSEVHFFLRVCDWCKKRQTHLEASKRLLCMERVILLYGWWQIAVKVAMCKAPIIQMACLQVWGSWLHFAVM